MVCMCVHASIYAHVWNVCIQVCMYRCACKYMCTCVECMYTGMCVYVCMCVVSLHVYMYTPICNCPFTTMKLLLLCLCNHTPGPRDVLPFGYRGAVLHLYSSVLLRRCYKTWNQGECNILASTFISKHNVLKIHLGFCVSVVLSFGEQPSAATQYPGVYSAHPLVNGAWVVPTS